MSMRRKRRSWSEDEKREICQKAVLPGASVAQVARRYSANANMIHNWLKDARFAPLSEISSNVEGASFVELELAPADCAVAPEIAVTSTAPLSASRVDITLTLAPAGRTSQQFDIFVHA